MQLGKVLLLALAAMLAGAAPVFAAPAEEAMEAAPEMAEPATIEYWTTQDQSDRQATIRLIADTFMALNPHVTVNVVPVAEPEVPAQLSAAAAAGSLPDVIEFGSENAIAFGAQGLLDADAHRALIDSIGRDRFYAGALHLLRAPTGMDDYYALPFHGWIQGIWYRTDWFEEAGLEPPDSWDNIRAAAEHFYDPGANQYGILVGTKSEPYAEQVFTQFAISNGARLFDAGGNLVFNSPEMKEALEYYLEVAQYNPPGPQTWRARDYYLQGKMAMFFYSTYIMDDLALQEVAAGSLTGDNFADLAGGDFDPELANKTGFVPIITGTEPASYGVVVALGVFKNDDAGQLAAAQDWVEYLYTEDAYVTYLHMAPGGMNPVLKGVASSAAFVDDPKGVHARYGAEKMGEIVEGLENIQRFGIVEGNLIEDYGAIFAQQIIPQMIFRITQEGEEIDSAMAWAEAEMQKVIDG